MSKVNSIINIDRPLPDEISPSPLALSIKLTTNKKGRKKRLFTINYPTCKVSATQVDLMKKYNPEDSDDTKINKCSKKYKCNPVLNRIQDSFENTENRKFDFRGGVSNQNLNENLNLNENDDDKDLKYIHYHMEDDNDNDEDDDFFLDMNEEEQNFENDDNKDDNNDDDKNDDDPEEKDLAILHVLKNANKSK